MTESPLTQRLTTAVRSSFVVRFLRNSRSSRSLPSLLLRKEVIQAHLPVLLPCYDFVPVTSPTFDGSLLSVRIPASGVASFHDVTGGVYKARERIHRSMADLRLLATPSSRRRVAACDLNGGRLCGLAPPRGLATCCTEHCSVCVAQDIKARLT